MSTEKLIAALPLAALFAAVALHTPSASAQEAATAPATAPAPQGMVVVRDAQTGQLRAPTATEMQTLTRQGQNQSQAKSQAQGQTRALAAPAKPDAVTRPNGTRRVYMGNKNQVYTVVTRDADGNLVNHCVEGEEAAKAAVDQPAAATKEHAHEDR
jgi:hypothetical protein